MLETRDLKVYFPVKRGLIIQRTVGVVKAVDGVDIQIKHGETLGLVGESGSGKTTLGRAILRLSDASGGSIRYEGEDVLALRGRGMRQLRQKIGMVFQDPYGSLNPRMTVGNIVAEPMLVHKIFDDRSKIKDRVMVLFDTVGLNRSMATRYPDEFSGGQRQRIGIARALASGPSLLICDEPVSALDVSIQAQIISLFDRLKVEQKLTYLFIAHDLSVVRHVSDTVAVMYLGKVVEQGNADDIYRDPQHPYTQALLSAVPIPDPAVESKRARVVLKGDMPSPLNPPKGCVFNTRCPISEERCFVEVPLPHTFTDGRQIACHVVFPQFDASSSAGAKARLDAQSLESREERFAAMGGSRKETAFGQLSADSSSPPARAMVSKGRLALIAGAVLLGAALAMFLFEFGLGAQGDHSVVPAAVIESRIDEFVDGQGCVREDAVVQLDISNAEYARVVYLRDNPSRPGSYLPPRVEYRYHYADGTIESIPEVIGDFCY
ncbi:MAG: ATP-binding cassette domain-containing protein [Chloroflexi bacterium]|nr:ATP-binding cassette domain-containing protein [Chloroflexota bacterium]